ncbi:MAG: 50S ribosomal protein L18 [Sandaracinaceae bacterium]|nr:50S ribosomal protein L18 [Sandaracinaceae bacterium]
MAVDLLRLRRKKRIRKKISGTPERPRLSVFRSAKHIYAQVIDDSQGCTLVHLSSLSPHLREEIKGKTKCEVARIVGLEVAAACKQKGIQRVAFDRNGYAYHGRVKSLAEGAREGGLEF